VEIETESFENGNLHKKVALKKKKGSKEIPESGGSADGKHQTRDSYIHRYSCKQLKAKEQT